MTRVLVALDEFPASRRAARQAVRLFAGPGTEFLVINVARVPMPWVPAGSFGAVSGLEAGWELEVPHVDEHDVEEMAKRAGIGEPHVLTAAGDPVERICAAADEHDVDVIVVGGHDRGFLARLVQPSVAAGVVRATFRPVLVVSGSETGPGGDEDPSSQTPTA